jgi:N-acetylglucosaminyldiphosphoundecaprenol N-acetyl-beta-D-mannosaminyltransferase
MSTAPILGCNFAPLTCRETLDEIFSLIKNGERGYLCTVNVAILMMMRRDAGLRNFIEKAWCCVADGTPLVWASRLLGRPLPERVTGVDLVETLCRRAAESDVGVYLLGAQRHVVERVARRLCERYPGLKINGYDDGYFEEEGAQARAEAVRDSGAKILIVAMGVPRQERFIEEQWERLGVNFAIGVGGSFDVLAGLRKRAPAFLQRIGLEWTYRLCQEPRRLFHRYLTTNSRFLFLMAREWMLDGRSTNGEQHAIDDGHWNSTRGD